MNERDKELALQAGCHSAVLLAAWGSEDALCDLEICDLDHLQKFADLIRADERGACAKLCETLELPTWPDKVRQPLAQAIRARGNT
jgi:hypothetical protein